jgi:hypothetical protein
MNSTTSKDQRASSMLRTVVETIQSKHVKHHTKRIIFVSSLYTRVSRLEKLQQSAVAKLNQLMVLATNENSLPLATRLQSVIWNNTEINTTLSPDVLNGPLSEEQKRELSTRVVDMSPSWLRYGKPSMIKDVQKLLSQFGPSDSDSLVLKAAQLRY